MSRAELELPAPSVRAKKEKRPKDPERQRIGRRSRVKGAEGEREVAALLIDSGLFPDARRRVTGEESAQIMVGVDILNTPGLAVQVRYGARTEPEKKLAEALAALPDVHRRDPGAIAVAFTRKPRRDWNVTLRAADFLALLAAAKRGGA